FEIPATYPSSSAYGGLIDSRAFCTNAQEPTWLSRLIGATGGGLSGAPGPPPDGPPLTGAPGLQTSRRGPCRSPERVRRVEWFRRAPHAARQGGEPSAAGRRAARHRRRSIASTGRAPGGRR